MVRNGLAVAPPVELPAEAPTPRLVVLSRLVPHKQIEHAFVVVRGLAPTVPDLHLDVVGDGWWHDELVAAAACEGVTNRVTFHGHVSDARRDEREVVVTTDPLAGEDLAGDVDRARRRRGLGGGHTGRHRAAIPRRTRRGQSGPP